MERKGDTSWNGVQGFVKETGERVNQEKNRDQQD